VPVSSVIASSTWFEPVASGRSRILYDPARRLSFWRTTPLTMTSTSEARSSRSVVRADARRTSPGASFCVDFSIDTPSVSMLRWIGMPIASVSPTCKRSR
jgi:hypothetical protein